MARFFSVSLDASATSASSSATSCTASAVACAASQSAAAASAVTAASAGRYFVQSAIAQASTDITATPSAFVDLVSLTINVTNANDYLLIDGVVSGLVTTVAGQLQLVLDGVVVTGSLALMALGIGTSHVMGRVIVTTTGNHTVKIQGKAGTLGTIVVSALTLAGNGATLRVSEVRA